MKNVTALAAAIVLGASAFAGTASAQMMGAVQDPAASQNLQAALQNIYQNQGVSDRASLDCAKVSDGLLEKLGDAYMEAIHPGTAHEYMDQMMGGEGSASLESAHIAMGRSYLGCSSGTIASAGNGAGWYGVPMMGSYGFPAMMGGYGFSSGFGSFAAFVWTIAGILLCIVLVRELGKHKHHD